MAQLIVTTSDDAGVIRVTADGELDLATADRLERAIAAAEERAGRSSLVLDFSRLQFMDSTGLQVLLDADVRAAEAGRRLVIVPGDGEARRVLELVDALTRLRVAEIR